LGWVGHPKVVTGAKILATIIVVDPARHLTGH
jgi:hypothetical protein